MRWPQAGSRPSGEKVPHPRGRSACSARPHCTAGGLPRTWPASPGSSSVRPQASSPGRSFESTGERSALVRIAPHRTARLAFLRRDPVNHAGPAAIPVRYGTAGRVRPAPGARDPGARAGFLAEVAVLPITVAALMTPRWIARHLDVPEGIDKVVLPGHCAGTCRRFSRRRPAYPSRLGRSTFRSAPPFRRGRPVSDRVWSLPDRDPRRDQPRPPTIDRGDPRRRPDGFATKGPT